MNVANRYLMLARREFWEHRSLWLAPVAIVGLLLLAATFGALKINNGMHITADHPIPADAVRYVGELSLLGITATIGLFAGIVILAYLLDCLYAERRDRSILFWKSLPVSDAETVLTKLAVAVVCVPALVLVLALVLQPLLIGIAALRVPNLRPHATEMIGAGLGALPRLAGLGLFEILWYAPLAAYIMLASVLAKRAPIVYAILPPVALGIAELLLFGSSHVYRFVLQRVVPWPTRGQVLVEHTASGWTTLSHEWWRLLQDPALWLGVVAAAALVYAVIRLRRYRDDT